MLTYDFIQVWRQTNIATYKGNWVWRWKCNLSLVECYLSLNRRSSTAVAKLVYRTQFFLLTSVWFPRHCRGSRDNGQVRNKIDPWPSVTTNLTSHTLLDHRHDLLFTVFALFTSATMRSNKILKTFVGVSQYPFNESYSTNKIKQMNKHECTDLGQTWSEHCGVKKHERVVGAVSLALICGTFKIEFDVWRKQATNRGQIRPIQRLSIHMV